MARVVHNPWDYTNFEVLRTPLEIQGTEGISLGIPQNRTYGYYTALRDDDDSPVPKSFQEAQTVVTTALLQKEWRKAFNDALAFSQAYPEREAYFRLVAGFAGSAVMHEFNRLAILLTKGATTEENSEMHFTSHKRMGENHGFSYNFETKLPEYKDEAARQRRLIAELCYEWALKDPAVSLQFLLRSSPGIFKAIEDESLGYYDAIKDMFDMFDPKKLGDETRIQEVRQLFIEKAALFRHNNMPDKLQELCFFGEVSGLFTEAEVIAYIDSCVEQYRASAVLAFRNTEFVALGSDEQKAIHSKHAVGISHNRFGDKIDTMWRGKHPREARKWKKIIETKLEEAVNGLQGKKYETRAGRENLWNKYQQLQRRQASHAPEDMSEKEARDINDLVNFFAALRNRRKIGLKLDDYESRDGYSPIFELAVRGHLDKETVYEVVADRIDMLTESLERYMSPDTASYVSILPEDIVGNIAPVIKILQAGYTLQDLPDMKKLGRLTCEAFGYNVEGGGRWREGKLFFRGLVDKYYDGDTLETEDLRKQLMAKMSPRQRTYLRGVDEALEEMFAHALASGNIEDLLKWRAVSKSEYVFYLGSQLESLRVNRWRKSKSYDYLRPPKANTNAWYFEESF